MIEEKDLFVAGKISRTHGVNGECQCIGTTDALEECPYVVLNMDGLFVPFYVESRRALSEMSWLFQFENVSTELAAERLVGKEIYLPLTAQENADVVSMQYFVGFQVYQGKKCLGEIVAVDEQTENVLFEIENGEQDFMMPAIEDFIVDIDHQKRNLFVEIPDGLLTINN